MSLYERAVRPVLFRADPEWIHERSIRFAERIGSSARLRDAVARRCVTAHDSLRTTVAGIDLTTPIGLAAGYDKSARAVNLLSALGFGHLEIGSVSVDPSAGNPKPRLFRLPEHEAIIVHYGLPNDGSIEVAERLRHARSRVPIGANVVNTNRGTEEPEDVILADYVRTVHRLQNNADYVCLNLSCPNTSDGRGFFHEPRRLKLLLEELHPLRPLFLKVAPFADDAALDAFLDAVDDRADGFAVNLPPGKPPGITSDLPGAVSGRPCEQRANDTIRALRRRTSLPIIGSGGVFTAQDAYRKIRLGASLVQLFTALVYRGPGVVRQINDGLAELLDRDGVKHVAEAVGVDA